MDCDYYYYDAENGCWWNDQGHCSDTDPAEFYADDAPPEADGPAMDHDDLDDILEF